MLKLAFLLLEIIVPSPTPATTTTTTVDDEQSCDDGSSAWDSTDRPNWACTVEGCAPHEESCWEERVEHCFDPEGTDLGVCSYEVEKCNTTFECFDMWFFCTGVYHCDQPEVIGCSSGTCTTPDQGAGRDPNLDLTIQP